MIIALGPPGALIYTSCAGCWRALALVIPISISLAFSTLHFLIAKLDYTRLALVFHIGRVALFSRQGSINQTPLQYAYIREPCLFSGFLLLWAFADAILLSRQGPNEGEVHLAVHPPCDSFGERIRRKCGARFCEPEDHLSFGVYTRPVHLRCAFCK